MTRCADIGAIDFARESTARRERFDLVLDLLDAPVMSIPQPPPGYFAPGRDAAALATALVELTDLVGEFEKPKYFAYKDKLCAHGRSTIEGCTRCIDVCSTRVDTSPNVATAFPSSILRC